MLEASKCSRHALAIQGRQGNFLTIKEFTVPIQAREKSSRPPKPYVLSALSLWWGASRLLLGLLPDETVLVEVL